MLFLCGVTAVRDPLHPAQLLPMAGSEPSPLLPVQQSNTKELVLQTDFLPQLAACLAGEVRCALFLSALWQPQRKHLGGEELMLQQCSGLQFTLFVM